MDEHRDRIESYSLKAAVFGKPPPTRSNPMNNALPGTDPFAPRADPSPPAMDEARIAHLAKTGFYDLLEADGSIAHAMHPVRAPLGGIVGKRPMDVDSMGARLRPGFSTDYVKHQDAEGC